MQWTDFFGLDYIIGSQGLDLEVSKVGNLYVAKFIGEGHTVMTDRKRESLAHAVIGLEVKYLADKPGSFKFNTINFKGLEIKVNEGEFKEAEELFRKNLGIYLKRDNDGINILGTVVSKEPGAIRVFSSFNNTYDALTFDYIGSKQRVLERQATQQ